MESSSVDLEASFSASPAGSPDVDPRSWESFFARLIERAVARLRDALGLDPPGEPAVDAIGAFEATLESLRAGRYPRLDDPEGLWPPLLLATVRQSAAPWLDDPGMLLEGEGPGQKRAIDPMGRLDPSFDPDPEFAGLVVDEYRSLMGRLGDPTLRLVATLKLRGDDARAIAVRLGRAEATAERKLRRVRLAWEREAAVASRRLGSACAVDPLRAIDEACDRFEQAWRGGGPRPRPEDFADGFADRRGLLLELLPLEFELRTAGPQPAQASGGSSIETVEVPASASPTTRVAGATTAEAPRGRTIDWEPNGPGVGAGAGPAVPAGSLARFQRLRLHARGGLGAVFVAHDAELRREVALKQILDRHADNPINRSRFLVEAEITAWLEHPGIVPVYSLGVDDAGRLYYAMRLIEGESLREAIDEFHEDGGRRAEPGRRSLALRKLLRRFLDVCNTVEYAHSRGVIHRDVKPGNVVVGRHGETMLVDWGLAKFLDREDQAENGIGADLVADGAPPALDREGRHRTLAGTALGTPAYMSPEQAAGRPGTVGTLADVYSLGATLYDLLAGRTPQVAAGFDADGRRGGPVPPRRLVRGVPAALEAIALKAMARRPEDRYPSARALGEDVEHWLAAEPVLAYREPPMARAARWWRRHPRLTGAAAAALTVAIVTLAVSTILLLESFRREALARSQAEGSLVLAVESVAEFGSRLTDDPRIRSQGLETFRRDLLLRARDLYRKMAVDLKGRDDPRLRTELGLTNLRIARISLALGSHDEALQAARHAIEGFDRLRRERPTDPSPVMGLAQALESRGEVATREFRYEDARRSFEEAEAAWAALCRADPELRAYRVGRAGSIDRQARVFRFLEDLPRAEAALRRGLALGAGEDQDSRSVRADLLDGLGQVQETQALARRRDSPEFLAGIAEARATLGECLDLRSKLDEESPGDPSVRARMIVAFLGFATACCNARQPASVEARFAGVREHARALVEEHTDVPEYRGLLASCDAIHAISLALAARPGPAAEAAELAVAESPSSGSANLYAAIAYCFLAEATPPEAEARGRHLDRSMALLRKCEQLGYFQNLLVLRELRTVDDFRVLRGRPDFEKFLADLEAARAVR